jgi:hypothetical protein
MSRTTAVAVAVAFALGAIGCGSSSDTSSDTAAGSTHARQSTAPAKTKTQASTTAPRPKAPKEPFARQVFDACQRREAQMAAFTKRSEHETPKGEIGDLARAFPAIETARLEALEAIKPPARFKSKFEQLKATLSARRDIMAQWARDHPTGRITRELVQQLEQPQQRASELARQLRLTCSI